MKTFIIRIKGKIDIDAIDQDQAFDYVRRELRAANIENMEIIEESDNY